MELILFFKSGLNLLKWMKQQRQLAYSIAVLILHLMNPSHSIATIYCDASVVDPINACITQCENANKDSERKQKTCRNLCKDCGSIKSDRKSLLSRLIQALTSFNKGQSTTAAALSCDVIPSQSVTTLSFDNKIQAGSKIDSKCSVSTYLGMITKGGLDNKQLWMMIENHDIQRPHFLEQVSRNGSCHDNCQSKDLNAIYESLLAKNIIALEQDNKGSSPATEIFEKIIRPLSDKERSESNQYAAKSTWSHSDFTQFPVLGIEAKNKYSTHLLDNRPAKNKEIIKSPIGNHNIEYFHNIPLFMDFFINTYGHNRKPETKREIDIQQKQNHCYDEAIDKTRGKKVNENLQPEKSNQIGIASHLDIPQLASHIPPWAHSGKRKRLDPTETDYNRNVTQLNIPLVCGVSGTTNLALWGLFSLNVELNELDLRRFLLYVWATLCADGGHSLQEVLSSATIIANYIKKNGLADTLALPKTTLKSLELITKDLSVDGTDQKLFGQYNDFFSKLEDSDDLFAKAKAQAQKELQEVYSNVLHCDKD